MRFDSRLAAFADFVVNNVVDGVWWSGMWVMCAIRGASYAWNGMVIT
jgi:hypothetical protein